MTSLRKLDWMFYNLGSSVPQVTLQTFMEFLAPPQPDFDIDTTINALKLMPDGTFSASGQWKTFNEEPRDLARLAGKAQYNATRPNSYLLLKDRFDDKIISWVDIAFLCEYKREDGMDELDNTRHAEVYMEYAAHHER
ncbi:hypothetical protein BS47DRAFT_1401281 [Hydnum rufescens UP504]|uniref:Uncharacterized protein n=1 Tax=Hydnum rufescens UP504 TaxID=1448309 RepID=A0A9P6AEQ6_9AGAM|nr:hypothetical protein BS47DRAFT_1401281 [Hydnum rufescens UP504]